MMLGLGDALINSMAAGIKQIEGYVPPGGCIGATCYPNGTVAYQNNNPGNLMYAGQAGASPGGAAGFAKFSSYDAGYAALQNQIQIQINSGQNLTQFFNQYAPGNTKNAAGAPQTPAATQAYINNMSSQLGVDPSTPLKSVQGSYSGPGSIDLTATSTPPSSTPTDSTSDYTDDLTDSSANPLTDWLSSTPSSDLTTYAIVAVAAALLAFTLTD